MPAGEPDRPLATLVLVLPVVAAVVLLFIAWRDGNQRLGYTAAATLLFAVVVGVTYWRRYFR